MKNNALIGTVVLLGIDLLVGLVWKKSELRRLAGHYMVTFDRGLAAFDIQCFFAISRSSLVCSDKTSYLGAKTGRRAISGAQ